MATLAKLTDTAIRSAKGRDKPYKMADGGGLYILVKPDGTRYWRYNYRHADKDRTMAFGVYPDVSAKLAREKHAAARAQLAAGVDPMAERKQDKHAIRSAAADDFEGLAREMWAKKLTRGNSAGYVEEVLGKLEKDVFPWIGRRAISGITAADILAILERVEARAPETARRLRGFVGQVFRYAIARNKAKVDPTQALRGAVITPKTQHFAAITDPAAFGELLRKMYSYRGELVTRALLRLSALVFQRPSELREARWDEFDLTGKNWGSPMWEIPAERDGAEGDTKITRTGWESHLVPLSREAVSILEALRPATEHTGWVFKSNRKTDRPLSEGAILGALRRLGYAKKMTAHGFRASARTMAEERLRADERVLEMQISHKVVDPLGRAYNRTALIEERVAFMQQWADYVEQLAAGRAPPLMPNDD
ncbi:tyrosine-type recombinase/integrase [Achromobacter insolitus]|uniref:tyrosine-type recombinase/integrase n=1 Tax=Achromobacter insolitus TaxID=217204 RepID=UPI0028A79D35|nr:integrase arm-type DNA-binding domain-containing protein [Achromobacter insolitus]